MNLGQLKEIKDLRRVWSHEALDFTPWLAEEDNLMLLSDAAGLEITVDETESSVGDFNVDIYATETGTDRKIIIENQLEDTNHDHLGKLITYASGKSADIVIWVVKHAREEHRADMESDMGMMMDWRELPDKKASRILVIHDADFDNKDKWSEQFDWAMDVAIKMKRVFKKYL